MKAIAEFDAYDRLPQINCPTLVITGADDALVDPENSFIITERIKGANMIVLEPAGHCFWLEQPEQSAVEIAKFLASVK
jgi:3-oxoadipate enol-lactonase